jgi:hypothetical protein
MAKAWIRAVKKMEEKPHPNLQKEVYLNIQILNTDKSSMDSFSKSQWRKLIDRLFHKKGLKTYPDRYPFKKTEEASVIVYDENEETEEVFRGEVEIPGEYRGKDAYSADIYS